MKNKFMFATFLVIVLGLTEMIVGADTAPPPNNFIYSNPSTPSTPTSGRYKLFLKESDGKLYRLDSSATSIDFGSLLGVSGTNTGDVTIGTGRGLSLSAQVLSLAASGTSATGALTSTDWNTFNGKEPAITIGTTSQYWRGDKSFQTLDTSIVPENTNKYYLDSRAIAAPLTGFSSGSGTVSSSDSILAAINKLDGNVALRAPIASPTFTGTVTGTFSGNITGNVTGNASTATTAGKWTTARNIAGNSVDGSADVSFANKFIVQGTSDSGLSAAQFLGSLGTGIVKNTTTTGVLSIAVSSDFPTLNQNTTGNASTATNLAANPTDCASDRYATTIDAGGNLTCAQITNAGLSGSIAASKLIGTDITTLGTIGIGTWQGSIVQPTYGGTGQSTLTSLTLPTPNTDIVTFTGQSSTPSSPSSGSYKLYADSNVGKMKIENSSGNLFDVGVNWIINYAKYLFDGTSSNGINTYNDSSTTAPVDGTGGTVAGLTTTINTSSPIQSPSNIRFNKDAANRQGEGWSWDFTLERADYESGRPVPITFMQKSSTNYVAGDLTMFVYDVSGSALVSSTGIPCLSNSSGVSALAATSTTAPVTCYFQPVNQTDTNYRVIWHVASTNANAWTFDIARLKVSPDEKLLVAPTGPTGEIIALGSSTTPANFLPADGTAVSRSTYAELFGVIGTTYGTGDGSTTFNVPNGSGVFLRGVGTQTINSIATPTIVLGTTSGDTMQGHVHTWTLDIGQITNGSGTSSASFNHTLALGGAGLNGTVSPSAPSTDGSHGTPRTASETAPANIGVKFYIRYTSQSNVLSSTAFTLQTPAPSDAISSIKTPTASGNWNAMTGNSITLTSGTWRLSGSCVFNNSGTTPAYTSYDCAWAGANGADSSTTPAALGTVAGLSVYTQLVEHYVAGTTASAAYPTAPVTLVKCASSCTIFLDTLNSMTTPANARVSVYPQYEKVPDFTVYGVTGKFEIQQTTSSIKTPTASGNFNAMTGNSITLSPGTWRLFGSCKFDTSGTTSYTQYDCLWGPANGADSAVSPGVLSSVAGLTVISASQGETYANMSTGVLAETFVPAQQQIISCTQTCTVFLNTYNVMTTAANGRVSAYLTGERLQ